MSAWLAMLALWTLTAQASISVSLAWDPSPDTNVVGYALYYGNASGNYPVRVDAGIQTSTTVTGLTAGLTYYFVAVAYTADGVESLPSNEVTYRLPDGSDNKSPWLLASYHPSLQNTQTGKLTMKMFDAVWVQAKKLAEAE